MVNSLFYLIAKSNDFTALWLMASYFFRSIICYSQILQKKKKLKISDNIFDILARISFNKEPRNESFVSK